MRPHLSTALPLRRLSQRLIEPCDAQSRPPAALVFRAVRRLAASRPRLLEGLRWSQRLGLLNTAHSRKLQLWSAVAGAQQPNLDCLAALQQTQAWRDAQQQREQQLQQRLNALWNHRGRLQNPEALLQGLREQGSRRVVFWHHFDRRGVLPQSWLMALQALKQRQWTVVVSSSGLNSEAEQALEQNGLLISRRINKGLCLGAYRDFCCLLAEAADLLNGCEQLLLFNDSTLPIGGGQRLADCLDSMALVPKAGNKAVLTGMTDSIERHRYHLQSYWLLANGPLLRERGWIEFWQGLDLNKSKDDLIDAGEIGLSQALLAAGITLKAHHSLVEMLMDGATTSDELQRCGRHNLLGVNLSLFAWQSLLRAGCPLVKKQVLLAPVDCGPVPIPLGQLHQHLADADRALQQDLEELLRSRHGDA